MTRAISFFRRHIEALRRVSMAHRRPLRGRLGDIAASAIIIAVPLAAFVLLLLGWLDADDAARRRAGQQRINALAGHVEAELLAAVDARARAALDRISALRREADWVGRLRQMVYARELADLLIRRDGLAVFPPAGDWTVLGEEERRRALTLAADLYGRADPPQGWYADPAGLVYFRCVHSDGDAVCIALDEALLRPDLIAALEARLSAPDVFAQLRDPYGRLFWRDPARPGAAPENFPLSGALRGWTLQLAGAPPTAPNTRRLLIAGLPFAAFWIYVVASRMRREAEQIESAERKKNFLDKIAHDLRTPLTNLKLYCELLTEQTRADARAQKHCAILAAEVDRLDAVAANAMAFGRKTAPQWREAAPDDVLAMALEKFAPRFAARGCACTVAASVTAPLRFDVAGFERILVNLLDNACKYAPGPIVVRVVQAQGQLRLEVADRGPGLRPAPNGSGLGSRLGSGLRSGLGLAIVRDIAAANGGGARWINGQDGLRVIVTLPAQYIEDDGGEAAGGR